MTDNNEALNALSTDPTLFDLVITDHAMPRMAESEFSGKLLGIRRDTPIILYTGHNDTISPEKARDMGITEFLMKPLIRREPAGAVRRVLDAKSDT
jgi:two-component system, cell cycle sensor histidine kinase and response regulator CckA